MCRAMSVTVAATAATVRGEWPMNGPESVRSAASARILLGFARSRGIDISACLHGTGLDARALTGDAEEIASWQELQLIRNVIAALPPAEGLGLQLGRRYHLAACGIAGLALISAADVHTGLAFIVQFRRLFHGFCRALPEASGVRFDVSQIPVDLREFLIERDVTLMMNAVTDSGAPPDLVQRIELTRSEPADPEVFRSALECDVHFGCPADRLVFAPAAMRVPLRQSDPSTFRYCVRECQELLARRRERDGPAGQVRNLLLARPAAMPGLAQVAAEMQTTPRTLRRWLAAAGTSYRELLGESRVCLAMEMLESSRLTVEAIGERLGYSEYAAFNRAFKCRTGVTPHVYRQQALLPRR